MGYQFAKSDSGMGKGNMGSMIDRQENNGKGNLSLHLKYLNTNSRCGNLTTSTGVHPYVPGNYYLNRIIVISLI